MKIEESKRTAPRQRKPLGVEATDKAETKVNSKEKGKASRQRPPLKKVNQVNSNWLDKVATFASKLLIEFVAHALVFWTFHEIIQPDNLS